MRWKATSYVLITKALLNSTMTLDNFDATPVSDVRGRLARCPRRTGSRCLQNSIAAAPGVDHRPSGFSANWMILRQSRAM